MTKSTAHSKPENVHGVSRTSANVTEHQNSLGAHVCVQRDATALGVRPHAPALVREVLNSPGQPLDAETRSYMEPRFGYDFSGVQVHTDDKAAESARAVSANAYTAGSHLVFGEGRYAPSTTRGRHLIAHELDHVIQQTSSHVGGEPIDAGMSVSNPADVHEKKAEAKAGNILQDPDLASLGRGQSVRSVSFATDIKLQRDTADESAQRSADYAKGSLISGSITGGISAIAAGIGLIPAFESAAAAKRQAVAGEKQAAEAEKANVIATENLDVAKQALVVAENPPAPAPTTGGIVVNNNGGYADIPSVTAPKTSKAKAGDETEVAMTILRVSQGADNYASFTASLKTDGKNIKGGYLQDGDAKGYLGGSAASNLNLTLKPIAGPPAPFVTPKGSTTVASARFLVSGNNIAPRKRSETQIQHFSGAVTVSAGGGIALSQPFSVTPGTPVPGNGTTAAAVAIDLPTSAATPVGPQPTATTNPAKTGSPPPTEGAGGGKP
jgi:Domain of unknown function (DUF4157)